MSGFESFLTGFLGRTTEVIAERKDKAEDYFDQSIERARTIGQDQLRQRTENQQAMLSVANNLISQAGMPEDLVRQIANDGPAALEQAYQIYAANAEAGVTVDESFWRNSYDFYTEVAGDSDLSLEDFLGQVNGLYGSNLAATTQEGGDPFGAFVASGLGLNAMERARGRLDEYDIGGYSASDLLAMEARPSSTRPLGDTGFRGPDLAAVTPRREEGWNPSPEERLRIQERFDEAVDAEAQELFDDYSANFTGDGALDRDIDSFMDEAKQNVAITYVTTLGESALDFFPEWELYLPEGFFGEEEGEGASDVAPPPDTGEETSTEDVTTPPAEGVVSPTTEQTQTGALGPVTGGESIPLVPGITQTDLPPAVKENEVITNGNRRFMFSGMTPDGDYIYREPDGNTTTLTDEQRTEVLSQPSVRLDTFVVQDQEPPREIIYQGSYLTFEGATEDGKSWIYETDDGRRLLFPADQPVFR